MTSTVSTLADPAAALAAVSEHFGLGASPADVAAMASGPAFKRHSKSGEAYSPAARAADYAAARSAYGEEIEVVLAWAEKLAESSGVTMEPSNRLL